MSPLNSNRPQRTVPQPNFIAWRDTLSFSIPKGYSYDGCGTDAILNLFSVEDGQIVCPNGMRYSALVLPETDRMNLSALEKVEKLVKAGAVVIGPPPQKSIGLRGFPASDAAVRSIAQRVWGDCDGRKVTSGKYYDGRVFWGASFDEVAEQIGLLPDFVCDFEDSGVHAAGSFLDITDPVEFFHRKDEETDFYFLSNNLGFGMTVNAGFRVKGKSQEIFDPQTGQVFEAPIWVEKEGQTFVSVPMKKDGGTGQSCVLLFLMKTKNIVRRKQWRISIIAWPESNLRLRH